MSLIIIMYALIAMRSRAVQVNNALATNRSANIQNTQRIATMVAMDMRFLENSEPSGLRAAAHFNNGKCMIARNKENITSWIGMCGQTTPCWYTGVAETGQEVFQAVVPSGDIAQELRKSSNSTQSIQYIRNQKMASRWLKQGGFEQITRTLPVQTKMPFRRTQQPVRSLGETGEQLVSFTVVRDPIKTFMSAYLEIMFRTVDPDHCNILNSTCSNIVKQLNKKGWDNVSSEDASYLFRAFLDDVEQKKAMGLDFIHAWPQALKIDVGVPLDFIVKLETFEEDFKSLFIDVGDNAFSDDSTHENGLDIKDALGNFILDAEDEKRLCRILAVDYECFEYLLPPACRQ